MNLGIETEHIEFKETTGQLQRALEALAAMLNKHGKGKVLFGVNDKGEVIGHTVGNKTITSISQAIAAGIKPSVIPVIEIQNYDGKLVISVEVEGTNKPYSAKGEYLIRAGNENRKLEPHQLRELLFQNCGELTVSMESPNQDLTFKQLKGLYLAQGLTIDETTFAKNTGLLTPSGKYNCLAELLADENNCSIKVVRFSGQDKQEIRIRNEYGYKCMLLAMQQAYEYVTSLNETRITVGKNLTRDEQPLFDAACFNEAWTNACLHTKWNLRIPPAVYMFDDRIEVISTGGLPADYPPEDFFAGVSHPVNIQLQKIMGQLQYVEQTGHGVPKITAKYGREVFDIAENHITVTIPFAYPLSGQRVPGKNSSSSTEYILQLLLENPTLKAQEIADLAALSVSRVNQILKTLKNEGKIARVGANRGGHWEILEK
ncbi:MAG TPA: putative DNA binding domain-containing protein [Methanocorpusculum sp.]|nr:putative DNA binding domain-containing protein [Methanocorpusculum sp.]